MPIKRVLHIRLALFFAVGVFSLFGVSRAYAIAPTLSLSGAGGDLVQVSVTGDANAGVMLYYNVGSAGGTLSVTLGTTNTSGAFSTAVNGASYAIQAGSSVYAVVNGQQSPVQTWPSGGSVAASATTGSPSFAQSTISVGIGQTVTATPQGNSTGLYLVSNSAPTIANVSVSGTQITAIGQQLGTANIRICYVGSATACTDLSVTVTSGGVATSSLVFSPATLNLVIGQVVTVTVSGGSGLYISGATSTSITSQSLDGSTLTVNSLVPGTATVTVCSTANGCGSVNVTVVAAAPSPVRVTFDTKNPPVNVGQRTSVTMSGGTGKYVVGNNPSPNMVEAVLSDRTLTLTGVAPGSAFVTACDATNANNCDTIFFTVTVATVPAVAAPVPTPAAAPAPAPAPAPATVAPTPAPVVTLAPMTAPATTLGTSATSDALAAILAIQKQLAQMLVEIQTMQSRLLQIASSLAVNVPANNAAAGTRHQFLSALSVGSNGGDVTELQIRLTAGGYYSGPVTGFYGSLTKEGVARYQTAHSLTASGIVDLATRTMLNAGL